ncbi:hypothetical protein [Bradyrhizobium yuanmingense]|uniref:hypothetical protein n=1 Tax=Bradyrhizobium yuanmingense TaxID=108015 RepID=UPI001CD79F98|nr:hypothetical protein [Bradyrhizobium yuanmingense]MCA1524834.1 hypothetical protein [Bradyrhizobium yuanmingense]
MNDREALDGRDDVDGGNRRLAAAYPGVPFSNGFLWAEPGKPIAIHARRVCER